MSSASLIVFDLAKFRARYPQFDDVPDETVEMNWDLATCYLNDFYTSCDYLKGKCRENALYMLTAHITQVGLYAEAGEVSGILQSATVDKVTVNLQAVESANPWQYWLNQTPYGQQLLALLNLLSAGGFLVGGWPETAAFRRAGGVFY